MVDVVVLCCVVNNVERWMEVSQGGLIHSQMRRRWRRRRRATKAEVSANDVVVFGGVKAA